MTFEVFFDDGNQSIPVERFETLGDAIACYVSCILSVNEGINAVEIVDDYFKRLRLTPLQISSTKNRIDFNNHHKVIQGVLKLSIWLQSHSFDQPSKASTAAPRCLEI